MSILLLLLASGPGGFPHHGHGGHGHATVQAWRMRSGDGMSIRDFGRRLGTHNFQPPPHIDRPLENFQTRGGARLGIGFVQGHHIGFKLRSPF